MLENIAPVENDHIVHYENVDPEQNTEKSFVILYISAILWSILF